AAQLAHFTRARLRKKRDQALLQPPAPHPHIVHCIWIIANQNYWHERDIFLQPFSQEAREGVGASGLRTPAGRRGTPPLHGFLFQCWLALILHQEPDNRRSCFGVNIQ
ncbi:MAG: hypothetical protein Q8P12_06750, partial [bacterium]|nr:hypothetical protein [bacterium]